MKRILLILIFLYSNVHAQDLPYARTVVDTMASEYMCGRGYVNLGDHKAAEFIASQFKQYGLKEFTSGYFQHYSFPVNTFPGAMEVYLNDRKLVPGKDYLIDPASKGVKGTFKVHRYVSKGYVSKDSIDVSSLKNVDDKIVIVNMPKASSRRSIDGFKGLREHLYKAKALVLIEDKKLTWSVDQQTTLPMLTILRNALPDTIRTITLNIENKFIKAHKAKNLVAYVKGTEKPDSFLVFSAHYDHLGKMGRNTIFPGANDNASGIAMLLNLCKYYSAHPPKYSIAFMAFAGEEAGLLGSEYYTQHPLFPLSKIKFLVNMDLMGTGEEGMMVVNGAVHEMEYNWLLKRNETMHYLPQLKKRGKAANSDHYFFSEKGVPAFFFYTMGGIQAYHDIYDKRETLMLTEFEDVFKLITDFVNEVSN